MPVNAFIPQSGQQAQPVSAFLKGRAMRMAYETDKLQQEQMQQQLEDYPKQQAFERQRQAAEVELKQQKFQSEQQTTRAKGMYLAVNEAIQSDDVLASLNRISGAMGGKPITGMSPDEARTALQEMATGLQVQYGFEAPEPPKGPEYGVKEIKSGDSILTYKTVDGQITGEPISTAARYKPAGGDAGPKPLTAADRREDRMARNDAEKRKATVTQRISALQSSLDTASTVTSMARKAIDQSNAMNTGVASKVPGYKELPNVTNLRSTVDTIKANLGFQELKKMRFESPTGGALGQVAVMEIKFLQQTIASLETDQGEGQLDSNLKIIVDRYEKLQQTVKDAIAAEEAWLAEQDDAELNDILATYGG